MKSTLFITVIYIHEQIRKTFFNDITLKYPEFAALSEQNKTLFLFNNIDPYICKLEIRDSQNLTKLGLGAQLT